MSTLTSGDRPTPPHERAAPRRVNGRSLAPAVAFVVLFTLACGDVLSLPLAGGNFRAFYLVALFPLALHWRRIRIDPVVVLRVAFVFASLLPSVVSSIDRNRSALYLVWIALTLLCTLATFPRLLRFDPVEGPMLGPCALYDVLLNVFRFQIVAGVVLYAIGVHERTRFLYYEPSYFSLSLTIYCAIVAHRIRERRAFAVDLGLAAAYFVTSHSGAFALVLLVTALLNLGGVRTRVKLGAVLAFAVAGVGYVLLIDDLTTETVRSFVGGDIGIYEVLLRGGNRLARMIAAWDAFNEHPAVGVGLGAFETASQTMDLDDPDERDYLRSEGKPAINIYLELLATTGIVGFIGFAVLLWPVLRWIVGRGFASPLSRGVACMLLLLTWESNFLRPYLWVMLALCGTEMRHAQSRRPPESAH